MTEQWQELKETITEMRDNGGTGTQQEVCKFLANYMEILEKQMQQPCDDCISREAALEIIEKEEFKGDAIYGIERLPSVAPKAERRWIPCAERLPEKAKVRYWICTDGGYQCQCRWTNDVYGLGEGDRWAWKIFDIPQYSKVVAWMPLPKSYKAESEDKGW